MLILSVHGYFLSVYLFIYLIFIFPESRPNANGSVTPSDYYKRLSHALRRTSRIFGIDQTKLIVGMCVVIS